MTDTNSRATEASTDALLSDRMEILELTSKMGLLVDARDWEGLEELFADPVHVDYTSLNGGKPRTVAPRDLIGGWRQLLGRLEATQHLIAGQVVEIDGDSATCAANVQGTHVLPNRSGGPIWTIGGRYDFQLGRTPAGWKITGLALAVMWATGNQHIMQPGADQ